MFSMQAVNVTVTVCVDQRKNAKKGNVFTSVSSTVFETRKNMAAKPPLFSRTCGQLLGLTSNNFFLYFLHYMSYKGSHTLVSQIGMQKILCLARFS